MATVESGVGLIVVGLIVLAVEGLVDTLLDWTVGLKEGTLTCDALTVGFIEGFTEGLRVGFLVGVEVDLMTGFLVGCVVGLRDGSADGFERVDLEVGLDEGFNEGLLLMNTEVGLLVGLVVGEVPVRGMGWSEVARNCWKKDPEGAVALVKMGMALPSEMEVVM